MNDLRAALSGLTTRGRCLLSAGAVLALGAVVLGQRDLLRAGVFLLVLPLAAVAAVARTRYRLVCSRGLEPRRVEAGRAADVRLRLDNVSRLPTGVLLMEDALPYTLGGRPRFVLDRIEPHGVREVAYPVRADVRGHYSVGPLQVRLADPFGLCELSRSFASSDTLVVTPVLTPLPAVPLGGDWAAGGETASRAVSSSGTDDATTREYRHGDDLRKVHWRSTARYGELMVRREEQPVRSRATLLLDTRALAHRGSGAGASFEWAVSAVASVGAALSRSGYSLTLVTDDDRPLVPEEVPLTEGLLLDALAEVDLSEGADLAPAVRRLRRRGVDGVLVAVLGAVDARTVEGLARLRSGTAGCVAVLVDSASWTSTPLPGRGVPTTRGIDAATALLRAAGWRVVQVEHGVPLASVWPGLSTRSAPARPAPTRPEEVPA